MISWARKQFLVGSSYVRRPNSTLTLTLPNHNPDPDPHVKWAKTGQKRGCAAFASTDNSELWTIIPTCGSRFVLLANKREKKLPGFFVRSLCCKCYSFALPASAGGSLPVRCK